MRDLDATVQQETNEAQQEIGLFCEKAKNTTSEEWSKEQIPILDVGIYDDFVRPVARIIMYGTLYPIVRVRDYIQIFILYCIVM